MMRIQCFCVLLTFAFVGNALGGLYSEAILNTDPLFYWDFEGGALNDLVSNTPMSLYSDTSTGVAGPDPTVDPLFAGFDIGNQGIGKSTRLGPAGTASYDSSSLDTQTAYTISMWFNSSALWDDDSDSTNANPSDTSDRVHYLAVLGTVSGFTEGIAVNGDAIAGTTGQIYFYDGAFSSPSSVTLDANTWYNVALVRSGTNMEVFLNGQSVLASNAVTDLDLSVSDLLIFGGRHDVVTVDLGLKGSIDEVVVWNEALSANTIEELFTVPEPSTVVLLITAVAGLLLWRRK